MTGNGGGIKALGVPTDVPTNCIKEVMKRCYYSEVMVDLNKAQLIQTAIRGHSHDENVTVVCLTERRRRITSSKACSIVK